MPAKIRLLGSRMFDTNWGKEIESLDEGISLVIVHANSRHDPDEVSKKNIQGLIDAGIADYVHEFMAFNESFVWHGGKITDNEAHLKDYSIDYLAGSDYILAGGGLGNCHFEAYVSLLNYCLGKNAAIHLPADAIYRTWIDYEGGDIFLSSELTNLQRPEFKEYEDILRTLPNPYEIRHDYDIVDASEDTIYGNKLRLMLWSSRELMLGYLAECKTREMAHQLVY